MAKPPLAGRVKTRLSRDIGAAAAVGFYRSAVGRLLNRLGRDPRWSTHLAVNAPSTAHYECWPSHVHRMGQGSGDLGDRMAHVLATLPKGPAVIIGTDSPQVEPRHIAEAFTKLERHDAVFGPADDGGYWLIGLARRRPAPKLFSNVRWSTEDTLDDTVATLPKKFSIHTIEVLTDVDTGGDLANLRKDWGVIRRGPWMAKSPATP